MENIYLTNYCVSGIRCLSKPASLSFYKERIEKHPDTRNFRIKALFGKNGSGKSGIILSAQILREILLRSSSLSDDRFQAFLENSVCKKTGELVISAEFMAELEIPILYAYTLRLIPEDRGTFRISEEILQARKASGRKAGYSTLFHIRNGAVELFSCDDREVGELVRDRTMNLLNKSSLVSLLIAKPEIREMTADAVLKEKAFAGIQALHDFASSLLVLCADAPEPWNSSLETQISGRLLRRGPERSVSSDFRRKTVQILPEENLIPKEDFPAFEAEVKKLTAFLWVFRRDLQDIEIQKKEDRFCYHCPLVLNYSDILIPAERESSGIRRLITLFSFLNGMAKGSIVFIDDLDAGLHEVYLCSLLEYLMREGKGQLCFTAQNAGLMDTLKKNKKSMDFLSDDQTIYPWTRNGNCSPSKLYRNGGMEGFHFQIDPADFSSCFESAFSAESQDTDPAVPADRPAGF